MLRFFVLLFILVTVQTFSPRSASASFLSVGAQKCQSKDSICFNYCAWGEQMEGEGICSIDDSQMDMKARNLMHHQITTLLWVHKTSLKDLGEAVRKSKNLQGIYSQLLSKFPTAKTCKIARDEVDAAQDKYGTVKAAFACSENSASSTSSPTAR